MQLMRLLLAIAVAGSIVIAGGCGSDGPNTAPSVPPVATVVLAPDSAVLEVTTTLTLQVTLKDAQGSNITGRSLTWTSLDPIVASVSGSGLVRAMQLGSARIVVSVDGKADTARIRVPAPPVAVTLETGAATSATIGPSGGTLIATGSSGVRYTLVMPPAALMTPVAITMTPVGSVNAYPLSGGMVGGVQFAPSGLAFAAPATLTIETTARPPGNLKMVGLTYEGAGLSPGLMPVTLSPTTVTLSVSHFSGATVGFGTTADLFALLAATQPSTVNYYTGQIQWAYVQTPPDVATMKQVLNSWFLDYMIPSIVAATNDAALVRVRADWNEWEYNSRVFDPVLNPNDEAITDIKEQWNVLFAEKVGDAINANKLLCASTSASAASRFSALEAAIFWQVTAAQSGYNSVQFGLDETAFAQGLCAQIAASQTTLLDPLVEGAAQSLDVLFVLRLAGNSNDIASDFSVTATASGATIDRPGGLTAANPRGLYTTTVTPLIAATSATVTLSPCYTNAALVALNMRFFSLCLTHPVTRTVLPALAITTSTLPNATLGSSYSEQLQASGGNGNYTWTLASGQLPPGINLSANGILSGTPTGSGNFSFSLQLASGVQTTTRALSLTVGSSGITITTPGLQPTEAGAGYFQSLAATGGSGASGYQWSLFSGQLPPGISLSAQGQLTGSSAIVGTYPFTIKVERSGASVTKAFSIEILPAPTKCTGPSGDDFEIMNQDNVATFASVVELEGFLRIWDGGAVSLPNLRCLTGNVFVQGAGRSNQPENGPPLTSVELPGLLSSERTIAIGFALPATPGLNPSLQRVTMTALKSVDGTIRVYNTPSLTELRFPQLGRYVSGIQLVDAPLLTTAVFGSAVYGSLYFERTGLTSLAGFPSGITVLGNITLLNNPGLCVGEINAFRARITHFGIVQHNATC